MHLRGLAMRSVGLPVKDSRARMIFQANGGASDARIDIAPNGRIPRNNGATDEKDYTSFDGISYAAGS